jgi:imidazole glycerol-phosphate synthase subunit HisH
VSADTARPVIAILDYGIGNLRSAQKAMEKAGADARLTSDPQVIAGAAGVMLPGVGAIGRCMEALVGAGLAEIAVDAAGSGRPFLGVCVGMQMMCTGSDENGGVSCLNIVNSTVRKLQPDSSELKVPHMQWNTLRSVRDCWLLDGLPTPTWAYFVHSFAPQPTGAANDPVVAVADYGGPVGAVVMGPTGSVVGTQFHPEKSGRHGIALLTAFVDSCRAVVPDRSAM